MAEQVYVTYASERDEGAGEGHNLDLPLAQGSDFAAYQAALQRALGAITKNDCRVLVVSASFDTCEGDFFGGFTLQPEDFQPIGEAIASLGLPVLVVQEGGYAVELLGPCAQALVTGLRG